MGPGHCSMCSGDNPRKGLYNAGVAHLGRQRSSPTTSILLWFGNAIGAAESQRCAFVGCGVLHGTHSLLHSSSQAPCTPTKTLLGAPTGQALGARDPAGRERALATLGGRCGCSQLGAVHWWGTEERASKLLQVPKVPRFSAPSACSLSVPLTAAGAGS